MASSCARSLSRSVFKSIEKLKRELGVLIDAIHVARPREEGHKYSDDI